MAVMQLSPEQQRHATVEPALVSNVPVNDFKAVRHITPLVMSILMAVNNPYVCGRSGYEAMGVKLDKDGRPIMSQSQFGAMMMPKTVEVLVLLTCDRETLKKYSMDMAAFNNAAFDVLENMPSIEYMGNAAEFVSNQLIAMAKARAVVSDDEEKPSAKALADRRIKKKQRHIG